LCLLKDACGGNRRMKVLQRGETVDKENVRR
jgi:hypothetical protein